MIRSTRLEAEQRPAREEVLCDVVLGAIVMAVAVPSLAAAQDAAKGEQVYAAQKCSTCHQVAGKGNKLSPLDGVGKKLSAA